MSQSFPILKNRDKHYCIYIFGHLSFWPNFSSEKLHLFTAYGKWGFPCPHCEKHIQEWKPYTEVWPISGKKSIVWGYRSSTLMKKGRQLRPVIFYTSVFPLGFRKLHVFPFKSRQDENRRGWKIRLLSTWQKIEKYISWIIWQFCLHLSCLSSSLV